jgi:hypothetical protein
MWKDTRESENETYKKLQDQDAKRYNTEVEEVIQERVYNSHKAEKVQEERRVGTENPNSINL